MEAIARNGRFSDILFSGVRNILENTFIVNKVSNRVNAEVIFQKIKTLDIDKDLFFSKIKNLSEEEWSLSYFCEKMKELDDLLGISDEFLKKNTVNTLDTRNLEDVKWELAKRIMLDYAKFSKEFYDSLKYSTAKLDRENKLLMIQIMSALGKIYETSKKLTDNYYEKKFNASSFRKFTNSKLAVDHLFLRIIYILLNLDKTDKLSKFRKVLSGEVVEYTVRQIR